MKMNLLALGRKLGVAIVHVGNSICAIGTAIIALCTKV